MRISFSTDSLIARYVHAVFVRALLAGLLLLLPACAIPPLRSPEPGPALPETYNGKANLDNSAQLGINEFFNDPVLLCLIDQGLIGNRELKILDEEVQIAENEIIARQGRIFPLATAGLSGGIGKNSLYTPLGAAEKRLEYFPGKHFPDPLPNLLLGLDFLIPMDIWRELRNARDAATERLFAAKERRNYFVTRLVADIAENYYRLMALDKRLENLQKTIELQELSLKVAKSRMEAARGTALAVQRFRAEVRKNQSETLVVKQDIIEVENRINLLLNRLPQPVERKSVGFFDLTIHSLSAGMPVQLLQNRPDIRQAEHELEAAGLDVLVARARFFPRLDITGRVGYQAFNPKYLFNTPEALFFDVAGNLVAPLVNKQAIQAEYLSANARQLEVIYNYQRVILTAFTEVVNRFAMLENYTKSIEIRKQQLAALEDSVEVATKLFQNARTEYIEVLLAQRDLMDARMVLIDTKQQQLSAIVNAYQALGGGDLARVPPKLRPATLAAANPPLPAEDPAKPPAKEEAPAPVKDKEDDRQDDRRK